jgi:hypothetical protein
MSPYIHAGKTGKGKDQETKNQRKQQDSYRSDGPALLTGGVLVHLPPRPTTSLQIGYRDQQLGAHQTPGGRCSTGGRRRSESDGYWEQSKGQVQKDQRTTECSERWHEEHGTQAGSQSGPELSQPQVPPGSEACAR